MTPQEWYQVSYTRNQERWFVLSDDKGQEKKFFSFAAANTAGLALKERRLFPAKDFMVFKVTESYFSDLVDRQTYRTTDYMLV